MKRKNLIFILLFALLLIGLGRLFLQRNDPTSVIETPSSVIEAASSETVITEHDNRSVIDSFISAYNASSVSPISNLIAFDASDRSSGHYRTEFRLSAFSNASCLHGNIGNSTIDIVLYRNGKSLRLYVSGNKEELFSILNECAIILDPSITSDSLAPIFDQINDLGDYNGFVLGSLNTGYFLKNYQLDNYEFMLDTDHLDLIAV